MLEQLNRIELTGTVGSVNLQDTGDVKSAKFSIATSVAYRSRSGEPVIETTWLYAICFEGKGIDDLSGLHKGSIVHLTGRIRNTRYTDAFGNDKSVAEVVVRTLDQLSDELHLAPQGA